MATTTVLFDILARDRASSTIDKVGNSVSTTSTKMEKFHKVGAAAGVALAGGLLLVGKAAVDMTKKAAADEASASKLAQTLQKATGATKQQQAAVESWISTQEKAFGVTDDDLRPALSRLAVATGSVSKAQKLASLAMDVSAGTGKSLESVSMALAKAQTGNISGLSRLGIATKNAAGETLSLKQVTQQLTDHYQGAAAKAADTTAGKQKILTTEMGELQEQIGYKLLPVMLKMVTIGLKVVDWVSKNTTTVGVLVGALGSLLAVTWAVSAAIKATALAETVLGITTAETTGLTIAQRVALVATTAAQKATAAAQWLLNAALDANPIGIVVIALAAMAAGLIYAYKHSETFRKIVQAAMAGVLAAGRAVAGFFTKQVPAAFRKVVDTAGNVLSWVKSHWPILAAVLTGPFGIAVLVIARNWDKIKNGVSNAVSFIKDRFGDFVDFVQSIPGRLGDLAGRFLNAGKSLGSAILHGMIGGLESAAGFLGGLISAVKGAINSALNLPLEVNIDKGPFHLHATVIPALAKGGIVNSPTLALIGEAGPEAVVPLSGRNARGIGGGDIYVTVNASGLVDAQSMAKAIEMELTKLKSNRGGRALGFV